MNTQPIPQQSFNDDDVYVYTRTTLTLVRVISCKDTEQCRKALEFSNTHRAHLGVLAARGRRAKHLGLVRAA